MSFINAFEDFFENEISKEKEHVALKVKMYDGYSSFVDFDVDDIDAGVSFYIDKEADKVFIETGKFCSSTSFGLFSETELFSEKEISGLETDNLKFKGDNCELLISFY